MAGDVTQDHGAEIVGTRITVYHMLPHFLDPATTEAYICRLYDLTPEQVASARAFVLNNLETVLVRHLQIEARMAAGNAPEIIERAKATHENFLRFKAWLVQREKTTVRENVREDVTVQNSGVAPIDPKPLPTFREWFAGQGSRPEQAT